MFPADLISKIVELLLGEIGKKIIGNTLDSKRNFAVWLLDFYYELKIYKELCDKLLRYLDYSRKDSRSNVYRVSKLQSIAERMAESVEKMAGYFQEPDLPWKVDFQSLPPKRTKKMLKILEIYGDDLIALIEATQYLDMGLTSIVHVMAQQRFDDKGQKVVYWNPNTSKLRQAIFERDDFRAISHLEFYSYRLEPVNFDKLNSENNKGLARFLSVVDITNDEEWEAFQKLTLYNIEVVEKLRQTLAKFIREHFKIDELL